MKVRCWREKNVSKPYEGRRPPRRRGGLDNSSRGARLELTAMRHGTAAKSAASATPEPSGARRRTPHRRPSTPGALRATGENLVDTVPPSEPSRCHRSPRLHRHRRPPSPPAPNRRPSSASTPPPTLPPTPARRQVPGRSSWRVRPNAGTAPSQGLFKTEPRTRNVSSRGPRRSPIPRLCASPNHLSIPLESSDYSEASARRPLDKMTSKQPQSVQPHKTNHLPAVTHTVTLHLAHPTSERLSRGGTLDKLDI